MRKKLFTLKVMIMSVFLFFIIAQFMVKASEKAKKQSDNIGSSSRVESDEEIISVSIFKEGYKVIETFYNYLLSDCDVSECPDIFSGCSSYYARNNVAKKELLAQEWEYLRNNKNSFFKLDCDCESPEDASNFLNSYRTYKGYYFFNPPDIDNLSDSKMFCIVLERWLIAKGRRSGIHKRIYFTIDKDERTNSCKINLMFLNINGVRIEEIYHGKYKKESLYYDRDFNFFKCLGFDVNRKIPDKTKKELERYRIEDCGGKEASVR